MNNWMCQLSKELWLLIVVWSREQKRETLDPEDCGRGYDLPWLGQLLTTARKHTNNSFKHM